MLTDVRRPPFGRRISQSFKDCLLVLIILAAGACSFRGQLEDYESAVNNFHVKYDAELFSDIYFATSQEFKNETSRPDFEGLMTSVKGQLGNVKSSQLMNWKIDYLINNSRISLVYETDFEHGKAAETFVFKTSQLPELIQYNISISAVESR